MAWGGSCRAYAVNALTGKYNPYYCTTGNSGRVKGANRTHAVLFTTPVSPDVAWSPFEVIWENPCLPIDEAVIITAEEAISMLTPMSAEEVAAMPSLEALNEDNGFDKVFIDDELVPRPIDDEGRELTLINGAWVPFPVGYAFVYDNDEEMMFLMPVSV